MSIVYDFIFLIIAVIYLPVYILRRKFHRSFLLRLGFLPKALELNAPIWIHAVSVGEALAAKGLIEELRKAYPNKRFVISTVTPTGNKIAQGIASKVDFVTYIPLDLSFIVRSVIEKIRPAVFIIMETEIWPNLISCLYRKKIPVITVNGRISDSSFRGYSAIKFLLKPVLKKVKLFCMQTERDAERLISLGAEGQKVKVTGNMKFDLIHLSLKFDASGLQLRSQEQLLVCGSTHPSEEEIILKAYKKITGQNSCLRLLIGPRHPERAGVIEKIAIRYGFDSLRVSQLNQQTNKPTNRPTIFILDTVGELLSFYAIADIVFVGGSLVKKGGHNILEPASLEKPILFGPHMFNFRDIADLFLNNKAAIMVHTQEELELNLARLLNNNKEALEMARRARGLVLENRGATKRNLEYIIKAVAFEGF